MSWTEITLGEAFRIKHGFAFQSAYFVDDGPYVVLTPGNFDERGGFRLRPEKDRAYLGEIPESYVLEEGDLIVAMTEQGPGLLGSSAIVPESNRYLHNQRLGLIEGLDESVLNRLFLYHLFNTRGVRTQISSSASGTKVRHTSPARIYRVRASVPDPGYQERIASILSAYETLIENNRRRIVLLEEAVRLLYREWFVCFRFPGHQHVKIIDGLPVGWKRRSLVELAEVVMGQSPKSQFYNDVGEGLPFHQGVTDYGFRFVSHRTYSTSVTKIAEVGDILVSVRAPVGRINITRDKIVLGRGLAAIRSRTGHQSFLFYALKNHFFAENIIGTGAIYAATNKKELEGQIFLEPSAVLLRDFEDRIGTIDRQIACLDSQNDNLGQARDLLLPRLMNGEIAV